MTASATSALTAAIDQVPLIAILRSRKGDHLEACVDTLISAGVKALEITLPTPRSLEIITRVRHRCADSNVALGVGTVLSPADVTEAAAAGASFVVSPDTEPTVISTARTAGLDALPGAVTPTEIRAATRAGAPWVKLFPARSLGPGYVADLLGPLPHLRLVPVGGIDGDTAPTYLAAGAVAVGVGSPLLGDSLDTGRLGDLHHRAVDLVAAVTRP